MVVILLYFSFPYWLIGVDQPDLIDNALMVRIEMFFLFINISIGNYIDGPGFPFDDLEKSVHPTPRQINPIILT